MRMTAIRRHGLSQKNPNDGANPSLLLPNKRKVSSIGRWTRTLLTMLVMLLPSLFIFHNSASIKNEAILSSVPPDQTDDPHDPFLRNTPAVVTDTPLLPHTVDDLNGKAQKDTSTVASPVVLSTQLHSLNATSLHPLNIEMQKKVLLLPSPPWPQLDKRTSQAITRGFVQGVETLLSYNNTIVTAYYDFESKHSTGQYLSWINNLLQTSDPMIIFVEPGSKWFELMKERRSHAPTIIAEHHFDDLVMSSTFTESFWQYQHAIDSEAKVHKGTGVYKIWNEKMVFLYSAITLNPFNTPGFAWMDAGYFRRSRDAPKPSTPVIKINLTESGIPPQKVFVLHVRNDDLNAVGRVNIAGNAWFGSASAFLDLYPRFYATFWDWISKGKFIGSDQFVMTETCRRYKFSCHPYYPGRYRDWFGLSAVVAGARPVKDGGNRRSISEISPHYLFLDEPPKNIIAIPTGQKVTFCNKTVVAVDLNGALEC